MVSFFKSVKVCGKQSWWSMHQKLVVENLGETEGVALIDESGVVKQEEDSVGKIANSQVGVPNGLN